MKLMQNRNSILILLFIGISMSIVTLKQAAAHETDSSMGENSLYHALTGGKVDLDLRYRFEHVDDDFAPGGVPLKDAEASTLRTVLGYKSGEFYHFDARLAIQDVRTVGPDDFNDATGRPNAKTRYAVVADPSDTDVLESYLGFNGIPSTKLKLGRQIITYRDAPFHRYMGTVLWRQNWQVHDAVSAVNTSLPDTTIKYAYIWNVNRIFSEEAISPRDNFDSNSHVFNVKYNGFSLGTLEAYAYLLDFDNAAAFSTDTFGIRFSGGYPLNDRVKILYAAEYADQSDSNDNPADINADYIFGSGGISFKVNNIVDTLTLKFSYEQLSGSGGADRFVTILGTNHAFQGWADRFLITPGDGIEDFFVTAIIQTSYGIRFVVDYHDLSSDHDSYDYGDELDLMAVKNLKNIFPHGEHFTVGLKYSGYDADSNATNVARNGNIAADTSKFWAWVQFKY